MLKNRYLNGVAASSAEMESRLGEIDCLEYITKSLAGRSRLGLIFSSKLRLLSLWVELVEGKSWEKSASDSLARQVFLWELVLH